MVSHQHPLILIHCKMSFVLDGHGSLGLTKPVSNSLGQVNFHIRQAWVIYHMLGGQAWLKIFMGCLTVGC